MDITESYETDRWYRLQELSRDPVVGLRITALLESEMVLEEIKRRIMKPSKEESFKDVKAHLKEVYGE